MSLENTQSRKCALGNFVLRRYTGSFVESEPGKAVGVLILSKCFTIREREIRRQAKSIRICGVQLLRSYPKRRHVIVKR